MSWFYYLFTTSISVTPLILLLLWLAPRLNKRYSARFRTLLWLIIALRLLIPVSLPEKSQLSIPLPDGRSGYASDQPGAELGQHRYAGSMQIR